MTDKTKEECYLDAPYISFFTKFCSVVSICAINPQIDSGLFEMYVNISLNDTAADVMSYILHKTK